MKAFSGIKLSKYGPRARMAAHSHDTPSLCLVLSGEYEETFLGRSSVLRHGSVLCHPGGEPHSQRFGRLGVVKLVLSPTDEGSRYLRSNLGLPDAPSARHDLIARVGARMVSELATRDEFSPSILDALSAELLALFARARSARPAAEAWLDAARDYLLAHPGEVVTLGRLAEQVGRHPVWLGRAFRARFGRTPGSFQRAARVQRAMTLLANSSMPLSEVALEAGFCDQSHMTRSVKAEIGCSPAQFRRLN